MIKKLFTYYKIPLLISATLAITILASAVVRQPFNIIEVVVGCLLGTFILDSEYLMYAYILEPKSEFAKTVFGYIKYKDYKNLLEFINQHKDEVKDKALNSALFQVIMVAVAIFAIYASTSFFIKSFVLSILASSIYKLIECYFEGKTDEWFWAMKSRPKKEGVIVYIVVLVLILILYLSIL